MVVLTTPTNLCSKFKQIEELSQKLLEKDAIARFVDRGEDSKVVARLIDRLRDAIACYQVGGRYHPESTVVDSGARFLNNRRYTVKSLTSR